MNSSNAFYASPGHWHYPGSGSSISTSNMAKFSNNVGHYSSAAPALIHPSGNTYSAAAQFSGPSSFNNSVSVPMLTTPTRQTYGASYGNSFGDDLLDPYTVPGNQYFLPSQDFPSSYQAQDISRPPSWRLLNTNHSAHPNASLEPEVATRYGPGCSYYNSSASSASSVLTDGSGPFPGLGSLANSLPLHANNANRTLPNPNSKRASIQSITNVSPGALNDSTLPFCVPQNIGVKSSVSWCNENVAGGGATGAAGSIAVGTSGVAEGSNGKLSPPTRTSRDNSTFGYYSISQTPMSMGSPQPAEYMPTTLSESSNSDSQLGSTDAMYHPKGPGDTILSSPGPSSNLYSYSGVNTGRYGSTTDSMMSEGTLTNGQPYTRLRQPEPQHVPSLDPLRGDSLEPSSRHAQTTSIPSASTRHY